MCSYKGPSCECVCCFGVIRREKHVVDQALEAATGNANGSAAASASSILDLYMRGDATVKPLFEKRKALVESMGKYEAAVSALNAESVRFVLLRGNTTCTGCKSPHKLFVLLLFVQHLATAVLTLAQAVSAQLKSKYDSLVSRLDAQRKKLLHECTE